MNYIKIKTATTKKIKKNGKPISLRKKTGATTFDPAIGKETTVYGDDEPGYALEISAKESTFDNSLIKSGERVLMCVDITVPSPGDILNMQEKDFSISLVKPFSPAEVIIYYEVIVK
jgi:hypothetical protein